MIHRNIACVGVALLLALPLPALAGNATKERQDTVIATPVPSPSGGGPAVSRDNETGDTTISVTSPANHTDTPLYLGPIIIEPQVDIDRDGSSRRGRD